MVDLGRALSVAVAAAREGGAELRDELSRPGGPEGARGKAPADERVEARIRARLLTAFPNAGYLGEETGARPARAGERAVWVVDPNDGTSAFLRGERGSSVSIALVQDGRPILGVVYAYAAPDHAGDFFAWAEGLGPPTRNGSDLARAPYPHELAPDLVVGVAGGADRTPAEHAAVVAPARFFPHPSIAYRAALAAAGDLDAVAALFMPHAWDFAAAHALLRATGGDLLDERGDPVRYSETGEAHPNCVYGGSPVLARALARRPWETVISRGPRPPPSPYELVSLEPGCCVVDRRLLSRAQGCLLGQLAGDSLGSLVEFETAAAIAARYPDGGPRDLADGGTFDTIAGQPTDDSELALLLARTLVQESGYREEAAARAYAWWLSTRPFDVGNTIRRALSAVTPDDIEKRRAADAARAAADPASKANGALMRIAPLGIWAHRLSVEDTLELARADARLTHPNPSCTDASAIFAATLAYAVRDEPDPAEAYAFACSLAKDEKAAPDVLEALRRASDSPPEDFLTQAGYVVVALHNAFHRLLRAPSLERALVDTVRSGGDTDTNAAICGALLGAVHGRDAIPLRWRKMLLTCRPVRSSDPALAIRRPRPEALWPVDALSLAERLAR